MARLLTIGAILIVLTCALFWRVSGYEFVDWDDSDNITQNPLYRPLGTSHLSELWTVPYFAAYIPITRMLWAFLAGTSTSATRSMIADFDPSVYHMANLVVHVLNVLLVFAVIRLLLTAARVDKGRRLDIAAAFGAAIFAVHPLQVEPVAWVTGMKDVLCAAFSLLCLWFYLLQRDRTGAKSTGLLVLSTIAYLLALLSKSSAATLPVIIVAIEAALWSRTDDRKLISPKLGGMIGLWLVAGVIIAIKTQQAEAVTGIQVPRVPIWQRPFVMGDTLTFYLTKTILPLHLGPDYGRTPGWLMQHASAYAMILVPIVFAVLCAITRVHAKWPLVAFGIWFISILPVSGLAPFDFQVFSTTADRYMYFAMLGIVLAVAGGLTTISLRTATTVGTLVVAALVALSWRQIPVWSNSKSLFTQGVIVNPRSSASYMCLGHVLQAAGNLDGAIDDYRNAVSCNPDYGPAHGALGAALGQKWSASGTPAMGSPLLAEAQSELEQSVALNKNFAEGHSNLGNIYFSQSRYADALEQFQASLKIAPDDPNVSYLTGISLLKLNKIDQGKKYILQSAHDGYDPAIQFLKGSLSPQPGSPKS